MAHLNPELYREENSENYNSNLEQQTQSKTRAIMIFEIYNP